MLLVVLKLQKNKYLKQYFNPWPAEYFMLFTRPHFFFINFTCSIPVASMHFQSEWKTVWILIRWLRLKSAYPDIQCFQKRLYLGSTEQGISNQTLANKRKLDYLSVAEALVHRLVYFLKCHLYIIPKTISHLC